MWLYLSCNVAIVFYGMNFTDLSYYDETEIFSEQYQRPYQYLVRLSIPTAVLDTYTFTKSHVTIDIKGFLSVVLKYVVMYNACSKKIMSISFLDILKIVV